MRFNSSYAVWLPQAKVGWVHQFENDATEMNAVYVNDPRGNILSATTDDPTVTILNSVWACRRFSGHAGVSELRYPAGFQKSAGSPFTLGARWEF